jgi:4-alpha-glucanotransferase
VPDARTSRFASGRHAGVSVPLFSIPSRSSWGVGEIRDLRRFARWLSSAGLDFVQILPVNEMQEGQSSPYSALSAMAIDPIFIAVDELGDFHDAGGIAALDPEDRERIAAARRARTIDYRSIRLAKRHALHLAFQSFVAPSASTRATDDFAAFVERERWWLDDYALFRALHDEHHGRYWIEWGPPLRDRQPAALDAARARLSTEIRYYEYLQWIAAAQWARARRDCAEVGIVGDFPFMVSGHSADVWSRQREFRLDASVGVPPDAFSATGQDWGMPVYRWDVMAPGGYEWLAHRAARCAELFDAFRIDHLVGFFRTYLREPDGTASFVPPDEASQVAQGEALVALFARFGPRIIAEDLGVIPDFVRASLADLGVPGMKVLRWEREWKKEGRPFRDPATYPACSAALSGTHDTETVAEWWEAADPEERLAVSRIPSVRAAGCSNDARFTPTIRDALITALYDAGSDIMMLTMQDIFGWRDRINTPALVSDANWSWRLPWPVDDLMTEPEAVERANFLRGLARRSGRGLV